MRGAWPVAVAVAVRLAAWWFVSPARLASDEDSYVQVATTLLNTGQPDLFWPPVTGWLIALFSWAFHTTDIRWIRLAWIAMDIGCVVAVRVLAWRAATAALADDARAERVANAAALAYALYLPAISFAQFATSEIPAALLVLMTLVVLSRPRGATGAFAAAGVLTGVLTVTRPSLLPLLVLLPAAAVFRKDRWRRHGLVFVVAGATVVTAVMLRNFAAAGAFTIAQNSAYNLYIGNRDLYAEDLDLFHPVATEGQIEFRRQYFANELAYPALTPDQLQREAFAWIAAHPGVFARRAVGRLARVFAPKTDVLELLGGERAAGIFSPASLTLLGLANLQWVLVLFAGLAGLAALWRAAPEWGRLFAATIVGSLPLCLVAISKPRYAFGFEPVLIIGAVFAFTTRQHLAAALTRRDRWILAGCTAFLLWGWAAWVIFAITSRVALANAS